jgi:porin
MEVSMRLPFSRHGFSLWWFLGLVLGLSGLANGNVPLNDGDPKIGGIAANPQAVYSFLGWDQLGRVLGLQDESGIRVGGFLISEFNQFGAGGADPHSSHASLALGIHTLVDLHTAAGIRGGTAGVEFFGFTGGAITNDSGCIQMFSNMDGGAPRSRVEIMQAWWHQRLFDDKFIFQIGKMNAAGHFGTVTKPVFVSESHLQDRGSDISSLVWVPVGLNPTMLTILPAYYNTAYGATLHFAPTRSIYASYGIFDGNLARGDQTGRQWKPQFNAYTLHLGEVGYSWRVGGQGQPGRFGMGVWEQTGDFFTPDLTIENGARGYYLFANQRLWYQNPGINNAGIIGYVQYAHTGSDSVMAQDYMGAGLSAVGLVPERPYDTISAGIAWSELNELPGAGSFFYPGTSSASEDLRDHELMLQVAYLTTFVCKTSDAFWTISPQLAYTYIPSPGQRPDLDAAHVFTVRLVVLF